MKKGVLSGVAPAVAFACVLCAAVSAAALPEGYEEIEGIKSTKSGGQWLLTDYVPSSCNVKIEAKVTLTEWSTQGIWCSRMGQTDRTMTLFTWAASNFFRADRNIATGKYVNQSVGLGSPTTLTADYKTRTFALNGTEVSGFRMGEGDFTPASRLGFFASHTNGSSPGNYAVMTLHGAKVWNADGTLEREYVPARRPANADQKTEFGLYETKEGKFFTSQGANGFVAEMATRVTWSEDAAGDAWIIDVSGTHIMTDEDAARLTANTHANLIKRGSGLLIGTPIQAYVGNITIEAGVFRLSHRYDCGADDVGWIRVCDGASLDISGYAATNVDAEKRALTGKTIYTAGNGYAGQGALSGGVSWNSCSNCRFILEGDSYYYPTAEYNFLNYIDLAGHKLTARQVNTWTRWGLSKTTITNSVPSSSATFDFVGGMLRSETMSTFAGRATDGVVKIHSDNARGVSVITTEGITSKWPVELGPNVLYAARKITDKTRADQGVLSGPLTFRGKVELANNIEGGVNALVNLKGTLTGSGTTDIGTGWVNYHTTANDYAGTVTVVRSNQLANTEHRAGIRVMAGATYSAAATTLENADIDLRPGNAPVFKGPVTFTGDAQSRITGGNATGARTELESIRKEGSGELLLAASVSIRDRLEVTEGKVRFPSREELLPVVGRPGLLGGIQDAIIWTFESPDEGVYETVYPRGMDLLTRWDGTGVKGPRTVSLRGYLWNRASESVTWTLLANHNDCLWLWIDGEAIFTAQRMNLDSSVANVTLTPGPHRFELITTSTATSDGGRYLKWVSGKGSLYPSLAVDRQGRGTRTATNFDEFIDPGDGSLFTLDDKTIDQITDAFWLADMTCASFAAGTEFDLGGHDYTLPTLEGSPAVSHAGKLTIGENWRLKLDAVGAGAQLGVSGDLDFATGAVLDLVGDLDNAPLAALNTLAAGATIATVTGTLDAAHLTLSSALQAAGAALTTSADGKSLVLTLKSDKYMRETKSRSGLELGFSVKGGKPYKQVRLDIYRDGVLIDQKLLGDAYALKGAWSFEGTGFYAVRVTRTVRGETAEPQSETSVFGVLMVEGNATDMRFVTAGADGNAGKIRAAVQDLVDNHGGTGRVYVDPGTYYESGATNGVEIASAIQVIGRAADPSEVIVTKPASSENRIFELAHADAAVRGMTIQDGALPAMASGNYYIYNNGGNVFIKGAGGTVENCIIKNGNSNANWSSAGGNVALYGGRLANCQIIGGWVNGNTISANWINCGGSVYARGDKRTPVVENCLITRCTSEKSGGAAPVGLFGSARMLNCTIADNIGGCAGGVVVFNLNGDMPTIANCAFYNNGVRQADAAEYQKVYVALPKYRTNAAENNGPTDEQVAACFTHCAAPVTINASCLVPQDFGFVDAANGNYALTKTSPLVDAGADTADLGATSVYDLLGGQRKVGALDIGCAEYREPKIARLPFYIIVR